MSRGPMGRQHIFSVGGWRKYGKKEAAPASWSCQNFSQARLFDYFKHPAPNPQEHKKIGQSSCVSQIKGAVFN